MTNRKAQPMRRLLPNPQRRPKRPRKKRSTHFQTPKPLLPPVVLMKSLPRVAVAVAAADRQNDPKSRQIRQQQITATALTDTTKKAIPLKRSFKPRLLIQRMTQLLM